MMLNARIEADLATVSKCLLGSQGEARHSFLPEDESPILEALLDLEKALQEGGYLTTEKAWKLAPALASKGRVSRQAGKVLALYHHDTTLWDEQVSSVVLLSHTDTLPQSMKQGSTVAQEFTDILEERGFKEGAYLLYRYWTDRDFCLDSEALEKMIKAAEFLGDAAFLNEGNLKKLLACAYGNGFTADLSRHGHLSLKVKDAEAFALRAKEIFQTANTLNRDVSLNIKFFEHSHLELFLQVTDGINQLTELKVGGVLGTQGSRTLAKSLKTNDTLKRLSISNLGDKGALYIVKALEKNKALEKLALCSAKERAIWTSSGVSGESVAYWTPQTVIESKGARALANLLKSHTRLKELSLHGSAITEEGAKTLARGLKRNKALQTLNLNSCGLESREAPLLLAALLQHPTLQTLNLGHNPIGLLGAQALGRLLQANQTLTDLDLNSCLHGDQAIPVLEALATNESLKSLDLWCCCIKADGAAALAWALSKNKGLRLQKLTLGGGVTPLFESPSLIFTALRKNKTLLKLELETIKLSTADTQKLMEAIAKNDTLKELDSHSLKLKSPVFVSLTDMLEQNHTLETLRARGVVWFDHDLTSVLAAALEKNTGLRHLHLQLAHINKEELAPLGAALEANPSLRISVEGDWWQKKSSDELKSHQ